MAEKLANIKNIRYIRNVLKTKKGEVSHLQYYLKRPTMRHRPEREDGIMRTAKRVYDFESFELDNIYNEEDDRQFRVDRIDSSIWYN